MPFADNGGTRLYYEVQGSVGDPVLLIPGLGGGVRQLAHLAGSLSRTNVVVTVDPRGAGQSDKPDGPYAGSALAADMVAVLDAAGVRAAHAVGISFGGMIAQELAILHRSRVHSLVLASSYAASDAWTDRMWAVRETMIRQLGLAEHFKLALMFLFSPRSIRTESDAVAAIEQAFAASPPDQAGYLSQLAFCRDHDARDRLCRIDAPALVVTGAEDILASPLQGRALAEGIPGARYVEVPEASHLFMLTKPEVFVGLVRRFLAEGPVAAVGSGQGLLGGSNAGIAPARSFNQEGTGQ